jgi:hypothetical protein
MNESTSVITTQAMEFSHSLVGDDWTKVSRRIPLDIEAAAQETKALQRKRKVRSAHDLLRLVLAYSICDCSLRMVGAWAATLGLACLSDVAVRNRLRRTKAWLGRILGEWLRQRGLSLPSTSLRLRLIDATSISQPGSDGTNWRVHVNFDLQTFSIANVELTNAQGGETLLRHGAQAGDIVIADRGYCHRSGLGAFLQAGANVVVRTNWHNLPLETADGESLELLKWLQAEEIHYPRETDVWLTTPQGRFRVRLIAQRLSEKAAAAARRRVRRISSRKGQPLRQERLFMAGFILLASNLPTLEFSAEQVLALYRLRWQVEVLFKRLKGILSLDQLRAKEPVLAQVYLLGKLLGALIMEGWTGDWAVKLPAWFADTVRPLSPWRWMSLWLDCLRRVIWGPMTLADLIVALPTLGRYLRDGPRKRAQQLAQARCQLQTMNAACLLNAANHRAFVLA